MKKLLQTGAALTAGGALVYGYLNASMASTSAVFGKALIAGPEQTPNTPTLALTYDDGPSLRNTPALLDLLAEFDVKATFFLIGNHIHRHTALARRVVEAGHVIGNHTMTHPNLAQCLPGRVRRELEGCQRIMEDLLGVSPVLFRPPYGARRPDVVRTARRMGLTPVLWNAVAQDWLDIGTDAMLCNVDRGLVKNRKAVQASTVLLHDGSQLDENAPLSRADTLEVTKRLLQRNKYRFTTPLEWLSNGQL